MRVELVNVAAAESLERGGKAWTTGIRKRPRDGPVRVTLEGLAGDEVGDREHHGGLNRALHMFASEHYDVFAARLDQVVPRPWVGENLTVRGYADDVAQLGDRLRVGTALAEVTMPTERCGNPGWVTGIPKLRKWMIETLRTGFYLRVLEPGVVRGGDTLEIVERGNPAWPIARLSAVMYRRVADAGAVAEVEQLAGIAPEWLARIRTLHARQTS